MLPYEAIAPGLSTRAVSVWRRATESWTSDSGATELRAISEGQRDDENRRWNETFGVAGRGGLQRQIEFAHITLAAMTSYLGTAFYSSEQIGGAADGVTREFLTGHVRDGSVISSRGLEFGLLQFQEGSLALNYIESTRSAQERRDSGGNGGLTWCESRRSLPCYSVASPHRSSVVDDRRVSRSRRTTMHANTVSSHYTIYTTVHNCASTSATQDRSITLGLSLHLDPFYLFSSIPTDLFTSSH